MAPNAKKGRRTPSPRSVLPAESELRDQCPVPLDVVAPEVIQQAPTLTHEHEQPTAAVMILLVDLQVLREVVDAPREERHLHLRRAGVGLVEAVLGDRGSGIGHARTGILRCTEVQKLPRRAVLRPVVVDQASMRTTTNRWKYSGCSSRSMHGQRRSGRSATRFRPARLRTTPEHGLRESMTPD